MCSSLGHAPEGYKGEVNRIQVADALVVHARAHDDETVHAPALHELLVGVHFVFARRAGRDQQVVILFGGRVADAGQELAEEGVGKARAEGGQDEADGVGVLLAQQLGLLVGHVAHFLGRLAHQRFGFFADVIIIMQSARDGGDGTVDLFSDVADGGLHNSSSNQNVLGTFPVQPKTFWISR